MSKTKDEKIYVNTKNKKLRIIAFILVTIVAIGAFSIGISQWLKKEPGYYIIEPEADELSPIYASGITLTCYFDGSTNEIKAKQRAAQEVYSDTLKWIYRLLDAENQYDGYVNIATINSSIGQAIELPAELFDILTDAYEKTCRGTGYNMFAGLLYEEWGRIHTLMEPAEFDPLINENERERIGRIAEVVSDSDNFSFEIVDAEKHIIRIDASDYCKRFISEMELNGAVLDLNVLREAYILRYVCKMLNESGTTTGFLTTDGGMTCTLSESAESAYFMYGCMNGDAEICAAIEMFPGAACCQFRSFALRDGEFGYYCVNTADGSVMRHPHFDVENGQVYDTLVNACVVSYSGDLLEACMKCIALYSCSDDVSVRLAAEAAPNEDLLTAYIMADRSDLIIIDEPHFDKLNLIDDNAYTKAIYE